MRWTLALALTVTLCAVAGAGAFLTLKPASLPGETTGEPSPVVAAPGPGGEATVAPDSRPSTTGAARAAPALSVEEALKDLDLIRPGRVSLAAPLALATLDGKGFRLQDHRGKVVFINFWATWCPPCLDEMPAMERLYARHRDRDFVMLAVSVDADPKVVAPFITKGRFTFAVGVDPKMETANAYGVRALPSSFIVDRQGNLAALALGPRVWDSRAAYALIDGMVR